MKSTRPTRDSCCQESRKVKQTRPAPYVCTQSNRLIIDTSLALGHRRSQTAVLGRSIPIRQVAPTPPSADISFCTRPRLFLVTCRPASVSLSALRPAAHPNTGLSCATASFTIFTKNFAHFFRRYALANEPKY